MQDRDDTEQPVYWRPTMLAWQVYNRDAEDYAVLVFATSRNRARLLAQRAGTWEYEFYPDIQARRAPQWDKHADAERVVETNADLPSGAEPFYEVDRDGPQL